MANSKTMNGDRAAAATAAGAAVKKIAGNGAEIAPPTPARTSGAAGRAGTAAAAAALDAAKQKQKLVRDSFTIPKSEYAVLDALKLRAARLMRPTKKSEVLRAGIAALQAMSDAAFLDVVNGIPSLKTGRPKATPAAKSAAKPAAKPVAKPAAR